jgi:hypothetical protein
MDLKEHASTAFSISQKERQPVSQWLADVKKFFSTTALSVSRPETVFSSSSANYYSQTADTPPISSKPYKPDQPDDISRVEDVLEGATIHSLVHLISILGNVETDIRIQAVRLLFKIAVVFDRKVNEVSSKLDSIIQEFEHDDQGIMLIS